MATLAHDVGALVLADAAQAAPRSILNVKKLGVDFLAFSGHKLYGPFGIGVLWGREDLLESMPPFMGGGEMISEVRLDGFETNELPYKFEAGTPPIAEAVGLKAAMDWLDSVDIEALGAYESAIAKRLVSALKAIPGVRILGDAPDRAGIVAFAVEGIHAHDLSAYLDARGIAVRAGHHCAHPLAQRFGVASSARASFAAYNDPDEADKLAELVMRAKEEL
jgi:cysteine desulfurase/selenocysteine lyase